MNVSAEVWARLLSSGAPRFHEPGTILLRQGEAATHVLVLVAGRIKASRTSADGSVLVLGVRGPGEILGDLAVLGGERRSATITAMDRCETRVIAADRFLLLVRSLGLEFQLLRHMMARIREGEAWRAELALLAAGPRLARTLMRLIIPSPDGVTDVSLDQAELGQAAGLSRSTVAAELARLRELGVVTTTRRRIVVTDLSRLQILAESTQGNV